MFKWLNPNKDRSGGCPEGAAQKGETMEKQASKWKHRFNKVLIHGRGAAAFACLLLGLLFLSLLVWPAGTEELPEPSPPPVEEPLPQLVTAEQMAQLAYTDSALGELQWSLSDESLQELNHVLEEYDIREAEEISQFLAQAAVESGAGLALAELGTEEYFQSRGYTAGTRGAGYLHLTHDYGQMAFATWMMKKYVPALSDICYVNPAHHGRDAIQDAYYEALRLAANLGLNVSQYTRIVYDENSPVTTGADYIAQTFAWESAAYFWHIAGIRDAFPVESGVENTDAASELVGGSNWDSRREAYLAFYPVLRKD